jgi:hypothetical protein
VYNGKECTYFDIKHTIVKQIFCSTEVQIDFFLMNQDIMNYKNCFPYHIKITTGWKLQIVAIFKIPILPNYNTYKKSKDCFGIESKMATKKRLQVI